MATMNISLPDDMRAFVESMVASGLYANASDYIRALVRDDWKSERLLERAIDEGEASGWSERSLDEIVAEARSKFRAA